MGGLDDILAGGNKNKPITEKKIIKPVFEKEDSSGNQVMVNFSHDASTKKLLHDLVWLKKFVVDMKEASQGDIIKEALELLAKKIDYKSLKIKYADQLATAKPKAGRKKGKPNNFILFYIK